jgi:hypothetical protein
MRQDQMENDVKSPGGICNEHLQLGESVHQFCPSMGKAVFYRRIICPHPGGIQ